MATFHIQKDYGVYFPILYKNSTNVLSGVPIIIKNGIFRTISTYYFMSIYAKSSPTISHGVFEASNSQDFSESQVLHCLTKKDNIEGINTVNIWTPVKYRYLKYKCDSKIGMDISRIELTFSNSNKKLVYKLLDKNSTLKSTLSDENINTYISVTDKEELVFIDLGTPQEISKIKFIPNTPV